MLVSSAASRTPMRCLPSSTATTISASALTRINQSCGKRLKLVAPPSSGVPEAVDHPECEVVGKRLVIGVEAALTSGVKHQGRKKKTRSKMLATPTTCQDRKSTRLNSSHV